MPHESKVFQDLRELSRIVSVAGPKDSPIVSLKAVEKSRAPYARLLHIIRTDDQITEGAALRNLVSYPSGQVERSEPIDRKRFEGLYRKTKSRLKMRLLNTLFVLDLEGAGFSRYSQA